jgi:BASS family bile acid:Na+ symporter
MHHTLSSVGHPTVHLLTGIALVAMMAQLGLLPEPHRERAEKRRRHWLLLWALAFNLVLVPLLAVAVARALGATGPLGLGLLVLAACPGGRYAPVLARASRGDTGLAVEITLFLNKLNPFISPLLVASMLGVGRVDLNELKFIALLLGLQILPYYGARLLLRKRPRLARRLYRPMGWCWSAAALLLLVYLVAHRALRTVLDFGARGFFAVLLFGVVLLLLGALAGGRDAATRRTFALTAETRNLALALVVADLSLDDPDVLLAIFAASLILLIVGGAATWLLRLGGRSLAAPQPT